MMTNSNDEPSATRSFGVAHLHPILSSPIFTIGYFGTVWTRQKRAQGIKLCLVVVSRGNLTGWSFSGRGGGSQRPAPDVGGDFSDVTEVNTDDAVVNVRVTSTPNVMSTVDMTREEGGESSQQLMGTGMLNDVEDNHQTIN